MHSYNGKYHHESIILVHCESLALYEQLQTPYLILFGTVCRLDTEYLSCEPLGVPFCMYFALERCMVQGNEGLHFVYSIRELRSLAPGIFFIYGSINQSINQYFYQVCECVKILPRSKRTPDQCPSSYVEPSLWYPLESANSVYGVRLRSIWCTCTPYTVV